MEWYNADRTFLFGDNTAFRGHRSIDDGTTTIAGKNADFAFTLFIYGIIEVISKCFIQCLTSSARSWSPRDSDLPLIMHTSSVWTSACFSIILVAFYLSVLHNIHKMNLVGGTAHLSSERPSSLPRSDGRDANPVSRWPAIRSLCRILRLTKYLNLAILSNFSRRTSHGLVSISTPSDIWLIASHHKFCPKEGVLSCI